MGVKRYRPTSSGRRLSSVSDFAGLSKEGPEPSLCVALKETGGRANTGRITCSHRGGGARRRYRIIDFKRDKDNIPARVKRLEYDPNRNVHIALLVYQDGEKRYILAPKDLQAGQEVISGEKVEPRVGNCMQLGNIPLGMLVHNVELEPGKGGQLVRGAGCMAQVMAKEGKWVHLLLPSGEMRKFHHRCRATIGQLGNLEWSSIRWGKAGRLRHRGIRPTVRGTAMNPVAHPMGGGEGRRGGGRHPCSPWGRLAKGGKTRKKRKPSSKFILRRRTPGRFQK
jgi:large subunit ribosomal protein L2